jgi:hypothetical protein
VAVLALVLAGGSFGADEKQVNIAGTYSCSGENPGGKAYEGTVEITKKGDTYAIEWTLKAGDTYEGVGTLNGNILSVAWKSGNVAGLVVYKVEKGDKGPKLVGKWTGVPSDGKLLNETLTFEKAKN